MEINLTSSGYGYLLFAGSVIFGSVKNLLNPQYNWLPNIPIQPANSLLGFTKLTNEIEVMKMLESKGPLVQFQAFGRQLLFIADKEIAKRVLRDVNGKGYFHNSTPQLTRSSIFSLDTGPEWAKRRAAFRKAFSTISLKAHSQTITKLGGKLIEYLNKVADDKRTIPIDDAFIQLTIGVICEVAFEKHVDSFSGDNSYANHMNKVLKELFRRNWVRRLPFITYLYHLPISPYKEYKAIRLQYQQELRGLVSHIRNMQKEGKLRPDSLAMSVLTLADMKDIDEASLLAEVSTFFVAGMDTTAHTLSFFVYCMAKYPEIQAKCHEAVDQALAADPSSGSKATLPIYVEAALKECMRKFPVAAPGSFREIKSSSGYDVTDSIHVPEGWWVVINILALHNYEGNWGSDVNEFKPERFLPADDASISNATVPDIDPLEINYSSTSNDNGLPTASNHNLTTAAAYAGAGFNQDDLCFAPFSYGARNCIGLNLALMELRSTIFTLLSHFSFELADASMLDEKNLTMTSLTMQPQRGLPVKVHRRFA